MNFFKTIQKIIIDFKELLHSLFIGYGDILFISGCPGGSWWYRCQNKAEELSQYGWRTRIISQSSIILNSIVKRFKICVLQRVVYNKKIQRVLDTIKKQGGIIIYETDDLVFNPDFLSYMDYYEYMNRKEKLLYTNGIGRELLEDPDIRYCLVSTDFLGRMVKNKYPDKTICISYNTVNKKQVLWARNNLANRDISKRDMNTIRIGYFSGSRSHNKDFETISKVVFKLLQENTNVTLLIVGYLDIGHTFSGVERQVEFFPFVSMEKLSKLIMRVDINIAPLEINNPFCQAKSAIKYFEAGLLKVPTIASATDSFKRVIQNQENGFLAETEDDWYKYISLLIHDEDLRKRIGENAHRNVLQKHTVTSRPSGMHLSNFIHSILH